MASLFDKLFGASPSKDFFKSLHEADNLKDKWFKDMYTYTTNSVTWFTLTQYDNKLPVLIPCSNVAAVIDDQAFRTVVLKEPRDGTWFQIRVTETVKSIVALLSGKQP